MNRAISSTDHIQIEYIDDILLITLNRPDRLNAISPDVSDQLRSILGQIDADESIRVSILTGAGKGFCGGGDVKSMSGRHTPDVGSPPRVLTRGRHLIDAFLSMETPIIAMVNGPAAGLGATLALFCDSAIMADDAVIGDRHVNVGLVAGDGGAVVWPMLIGPMRAKEMLMTGRMISGVEAAAMGLVNRAVPLSELRAATFELARSIAEQPPYAVRATKLSIQRQVTSMNHLVLEASLAWEALTMRSYDHQEALRAHSEKRKGNYEGR